MVHFKICLLFVFVAASCATPTKPSLWKGTFLDSNVEEMRSLCSEDDPIACLKLKALQFLDTIFQKDNFQISNNVEVTRNSYRSNEVTSRSENSVENNVEEYIKSHDVTFKLPLVDSSVTLGARNLDNGEVDLKLNFNSGTQVEARKSKLKKIFVPILVLVLLKAMFLIPLALGILGLKAWNALQLSFFSFVISVALAVFQLCKKIAADGHAPIAAHGPWETGYAARSFEGASDGAQQMAYSAHVQQ